MTAHRVYIIGDSLFSEGLSQLLGQREEIYIVGSSSNVEIAIREALQTTPEVFILAESEDGNLDNLKSLFGTFPEIPIILAKLKTNTLHVFANKQYQARTSNLISAITSLPKRS